MTCRICGCKDRRSIRFNARPVPLPPFLRAGINFAIAIVVPAVVIKPKRIRTSTFSFLFLKPFFLASRALRTFTALRRIGACFPSCFRSTYSHASIQRPLSRPLKSRVAYPHLQDCSGAKLVAPCRHPWAHVWRSSVRRATPFHNFVDVYIAATLKLQGLQVRFRPPISAALVRHFYHSVARATRRFSFLVYFANGIYYIVASVRFLSKLSRS